MMVLLLMLLVNLAYGKAKNPEQTPGNSSRDRPTQDYKSHTVGEVWSMQSNFGNYGDPDAGSTGRPSYDWPGGTQNYYLWEGRLWIGVAVGAETLVSHADYGSYEWSPSVTEPSGWGFVGKGGTSMWDINAAYDDWDPLMNLGKAIGIRVHSKALSWSVDNYNDFFAYEYKIVYMKDSSTISSSPDILEGVYISWCWDADVSNEDATDCHLDDLVSFDGWVDGEWVNFSTCPIPSDNYTILPDTVLEEPDGIPDQYTVFGDESDEMTVNGDTIILPRTMAYIYDADDPTSPEDDEGEKGACAGYICGRLIYAPPTPSDSEFTGANSEPCRIVRAYSHQWWNWENDPGTDVNKYQYMTASHPMSLGHHFMPHPFDIGAPVFDYRFLLTTGPHDIANGDTLEFVFASGVGQGLNGGEDTYCNRGYLQGARQIMDYALKAYYMGSMNSDPAHPSAPSEDVHWLIPVPPEVPNLNYSAGNGVINLVWDDIAEKTPDPMDGMMDFRGYRIYRSKFRVGDWELVEEFDSTTYWPNYPHTFTDASAEKGYPYYYCVTAYDAGRPLIPPLESGRSNYKKDPNGAEIPVFIPTEMASGLDEIQVVPNPYLGSAKWERQYEGEYAAGNKIEFINLPSPCNILIYSLSGDLIQEISHSNPNGTCYWNLKTRNDRNIVSGLYIYKVEQFDNQGNHVASKVGKFLILR
jgi:hypothetical protein